jgi:hypothetical protein
VSSPLTASEVRCVLSNLAYLTLCRSIQLLVLLARGDAAKNLEILVLHHQLDTLGYQPAPYKRDPCCAGRQRLRRALDPDGAGRVP